MTSLSLSLALAVVYSLPLALRAETLLATYTDTRHISWIPQVTPPIVGVSFAIFYLENTDPIYDQGELIGHFPAGSLSTPYALDSRFVFASSGSIEITQASADADGYRDRWDEIETLLLNGVPDRLAFTSSTESSMAGGASSVQHVISVGQIDSDLLEIAPTGELRLERLRLVVQSVHWNLDSVDTSFTWEIYGAVVPTGCTVWPLSTFAFTLGVRRRR